MARPPSNLRALIGEAIQHQQRGEYARAEVLYAEVLKQEPGQPDAHHFMGLLAHQTGRHELGESHVRRSLELAPQRAEFYYNYANMLLTLRRPEQAVQELQRCVDLAPGMTAAWLALGMTLQGLKFNMHAAAAFHRVLSAEPARADAWKALGGCMYAEKLLPEATEAYRRAQALTPADAEVQLALAAVAIDTRQDAEAGRELQKLLEMAPAMPDAHYQHGVWLANRGEFDAARRELERTLELAPDHYQAALYYTYITPLTPDAPLVRRLEAAVARGHTEPGQAANAHFALGYVLDKDKQYDAAFGHYLEANRLQHSLSRYSSESQARLQASLEGAFGQEFLARSRAFSNPSAKPLFVVGMPRSGTSLLEQILSCHPDVFGGGEMTLLNAELRRRTGPVNNQEFGATVARLPDTEL
ncbi:MAG TPA: tetratricopeptide repeat protein, partial [Gammaproteobacteria bacterium]